MNTRAVPTQLDNWADGTRVFVVLVEDEGQKIRWVANPGLDAPETDPNSHEKSHVGTLAHML